VGKTLSRKNMNQDSGRKPLAYYLELKYPITLHPDPESGYVVEIKELQGCLTQAETLDEAIANINEARQLWVETAYENGDDIPLPSTDDTYSGRLLLRIPKSLHRRLTEKRVRKV
jgi:predicted RNase H-like HicB family nuclease